MYTYTTDHTLSSLPSLGCTYVWRCLQTFCETARRQSCVILDVRAHIGRVEPSISVLFYLDHPSWCFRHLRRRSLPTSSFLTSAKLEMWNHGACDLDAFSISSKPGTLNQEEGFLRCFLYLDQTRDEESCSQSLRGFFKSRPNWKCGIGQQAVPLSSAWLKLVPKTAQTGFEHLIEPAEGLTASRRALIPAQC